MNTKCCAKCKKDLPVDDFGTETRKNNVRLKSFCRSCCRLYYKENKERLKEKSRKRYYERLEVEPDFKEKLKISQKKYYEENKDKISKKRSSPKEREKMNNYMRKRRKENLNFKIRDNLSGRVRSAVKRNKDSLSTLSLLGCSIEEFKVHIESLWEKGMDWNNHGLYGWHIDHIKPCSVFNLLNEDELKACFHWSNMQPLWAIDNLRKGDKY